MVGHGVLEEDEFDHETASANLLDELVEDVSEDVILKNGETGFLARQEPKKETSDASMHSERKQHPSCHQAWGFYLQGNSGSEDDLDDTDYELPVYKLLGDLGAMAQRDALNLSLRLEANRGNPQMKNEMLEVRRPVSGFQCCIYMIGCSWHILRLLMISTPRS
jgi:hypothetical protein